MRQRLLILLFWLAPALLRAQVTVTLPSQPFRPFATTLAASQAELRFNVTGPPGEYDVTVERGGRTVVTTRLRKDTPQALAQLFRTGVPLDEGANQFRVTVSRVGGAGAASSPVTTTINRELENTVSSVTLDAIPPFTRTTTNATSTLIYTLSGNAARFEVTATNSFNASVVTTTRNGSGEGTINVPLAANSPNAFTLVARPIDPPFALPNQAQSNVLSVLTDTTAPVVTGAAITFPAQPTGDSVVTVQGQTDPFADVEVGNGTSVFTAQADVLGSFVVHGVFLPLIPPGPTITNLRVSAIDAAGNRGPAVPLQATRLSADPRFDLLSLTPRHSGQVAPGDPVILRGAVGEATAPYTVRFLIRAGTGSFAREETFQLLRNGDPFTKDVVLSSLISAPSGDVVYSFQAQVSSSGGQTNNQLLGDVVLDNTDPQAPAPSSRFAGKLFTRARLVSVDGTAERFGTVEFEETDGIRFARGPARVKVDSTPAADGGEFLQVLDLSRMNDGDYSVAATAIATSGRTGPISRREILISRDTRNPRVARLDVNGTQEGGSRGIFLRPNTIVTLRVTMDEPMLRAPDVFVTERGLDALPAPLSATINSQTFEYAYAVTPNPATVTSPDDLSEGNVEVVVMGGGDRAGNPVDPEARFTSAFVKDSLPPVIDLARTSPKSGSAVSKAPDPFVITIVENPFSAVPSSGVDIDATTVRVFGPIETSPNTQRTGLVTPFSPSTVHFRFDAGQFVAEGTYRFEVSYRDFAGNADTTSLLLRLDSTPIEARFLVRTNPPNLACVNRSAILTDALNRDFYQAIFSPDVQSQIDFAATTLAVSIECPYRRPLAGTTSALTPTNEVRFLFANKLRPSSPRDTNGAGTDDGVYSVTFFLRDLAGNVTPNLFRTFVYDTVPPFVLEGDAHSVGVLGQTTEAAFFPALDQAVNGPLRQVRAGMIDGVAQNGYTGCGINTSPTTGSTIVLTLVGRFPTTTLPVGSSTTNTPDLQSTIRFDSIEPRVFSPCFAGLRRANILLDLRVDPVSAQPRGLTTGGTQDGLWQIDVTPLDGAGNRGVPVSSRFVYDTIPPTLLLDSVQADQFITSNTLSLSGTTFDEPKPPRDFGLGVRRVRVRVEQTNANGVTTAPALLDWSDAQLPLNFKLTNAATPLRWLFSGTLPRYQGRGRIIVRATDAAGNNRDVVKDVQISTDLLPAPRLRTPPDDSAVASQIVTFTWSQVAGASKYRLTVTDPQKNLATQETGPQFNTATVSLVDRPEGDYTWIVQAVDTQGQPGVKPFAFRFRVDTRPPRILNLFAFDPVLPEAHGGPVLHSQIRVGVRFSEAMDTSTTPVVTVKPANPLAPPVTLTTLRYEKDEYRGLVRLPQRADSPDVNGLARITVAGARDRAGNTIVTTSTFFEVAIGPFFEVRAFANPINRREILFHFKSLRSDGGPVETLTAPPFARVTQLGGTPRVLDVRKIRNSVWAGPYSLDPTRPGTATVEVNGTDTAGNAATRVITFDIQTVVARARAGLVLPGAVRLELPEGAVAQDATLGLFGPGVADGPAESAELVTAAALGGVYPAVDLAVPGVARVDLARVPLPPGVEKRRLGLYRVAGAELVPQPSSVQGDELVARVDALGTLALMADVKPPALAAPLAPGDEVKLETDRPDVELQATDLGSGIAVASMRCEVDGVAWASAAAGEFDARQVHRTFRAPRPLAPGAHEVRLFAADRAGNVAVKTFRAVAPEPFGLRELVPYPNPCRLFSRLRYRLTRPATEVTVAIHDVSGRRITTLAGPTSAGVNEATWDLTDGRGGGVANGVYLVRVKARGTAGEKIKGDTRIAVMR